MSVTGSRTLLFSTAPPGSDRLAASAVADHLRASHATAARKSASDSWSYSKWLLSAGGLGERKQWMEDPIASASLNLGKGTSKGTRQYGFPWPGGGKYLEWQQTPGSSLIGLYVQPIGITARRLCSFLMRQCYTRLLKGLSDDQVHPASMHSSLHNNQPSYPLSSWCFAPGHILLPKAIQVVSRAALQPAAEQAAGVMRSLVK